MLGSISPVGESARGQRWWLTVTAYLVASVVGGAIVGLALGALGVGLAALVALSTAARLGILALVALLGAAVDAGLLRLRLPTWHRQVNEAWLTEYRGWVYGAGFGFQLGTGFATIIPAAVTYTAFAAALLAFSVPGGLAVGVAFGLVRGLPVVLTARLHTAAQLYATTRRVEAAEPTASRLVVAGQLSVAVAAVTIATVAI
jgi:hypothetical protein